MSIDHYENFPVASILIPARFRAAITAIYRFARRADDLADEGDASDKERLAALARFDDEIDAIEHGVRGDPALAPVFAPLADAVAQHELPLSFFRDLLSAFSQDVIKKRYQDFDELGDYCRRSANPIGRLLLHLFKRADDDNLARSDAICTGLQLVNFWQDIAIDWQKGRVYLPQKELQRFGVSEADIGHRNLSPQWEALIDFQVLRAATMLRNGVPLVHRLPGRIGWEIRLTVQGGLRIAERIRAARGDIFSQRPVLRKRDWLLMGVRSIGL